MTGKIVLFGAGATGRGHVGLLAWQSGLEMVFVDRNAALVRALRQAGQYQVQLYGGPGGSHAVTVSGFRTYHSEERERIAEEVAGADLTLTAVFDQNLPDVALTLAQAAAVCRRAGREAPLNCIACENMMDSSSTLGRHVRSHLTGEDLAYHEAHFGYPDCMISRVVPVPEDPLTIITEDYNEWTARREAFRGPKPEALSALELVDNQTARLERKLFIHNGGHAVCGFVGFRRGHRYIHEAVSDPEVLEYVGGALDEIGEVVRRKHGFSVESIEEYKADLGRRGAIAEMRDEIARVVRDPIRKLSPRERLLGPALQAVEFGLPRQWIVRGIVAALRCYNPADPQSVRLAEMLERKGLSETLREVCELALESTLTEEIQAAWGERPGNRVR